jgi:adhesin transport system membrane fusion protein
MARDIKAKEDLDFMSELEAMKRLNAIPFSNALLYLILILTIFFIIWASVFKIEEIIRGQGSVVPSSALQVVQSLEGGLLAALNVSEGSIVEAGQELARIDNVAFDSEEQGFEARFNALSLKDLRLQAEIEGKDFVVPQDIREQFPNIAESELALFEARKQERENGLSIIEDKATQTRATLQEVTVQIERWRKNTGLLGRELRMTRNLAAQNAVPQIDVIRLEREMNDLRGNIEAGEQKIQSLKAEVSAAEKEAQNHINKLVSKALQEQSETRTALAGLQQNLTTAEDRVDRTRLRSPVNGIVKTIAVKTKGGVIEPAMRFIEIVPIEDDLKVRAKINPADVAFLREGLPVKVKISAYDPQIYGALDGTLVRVGADSVQENDGTVFFEVDVETKRNYLGDDDAKLPIIPGMVADVEIITGKRSIMTYLLKPVLRARDRALTER